MDLKAVGQRIKSAREAKNLTQEELAALVNLSPYTKFRTIIRSGGGVTMDLKAVGQRIKSAREAKNLTQEELAALVNLSPTHVSVIERGLKVTKLDTFVAIANALDVSADTLLIDVVAHSVTGVTNELTEKIELQVLPMS